MRRLIMTTIEEKFKELSMKVIRRQSTGGVGEHWSLNGVVQAMDNWLLPSKTAANWDNVGLLVAPDIDINEKKVKKIMLCNDLTLDVAEEAVTEGADLIVSYHPIIFKALKTVSYGHFNERVVAKCIKNDIGVYSPHTALDSIPGGLNDGFISIFRNIVTLTGVKPICSKFYRPLSRVSYSGHPLSLFPTIGQLVNSKSLIMAFDTNNVYAAGDSLGGHMTVSIGSEDETKLRIFRPMEHLPDIKFRTVEGCRELDNTNPMQHIWPGDGRIISFASPITVLTIIEVIKKELNLENIQAAGNINQAVNCVAVCAGSGASFVSKLPAGCDLFITGELSHHFVLEFISKPNRVVLLLGHCNSERFYLKNLATILKVILNPGPPEIFLSKKDKSPLSVV